LQTTADSPTDYLSSTDLPVVILLRAEHRTDVSQRSIPPHSGKSFRDALRPQDALTNQMKHSIQLLASKCCAERPKKKGSQKQWEQKEILVTKKEILGNKMTLVVFLRWHF
jgi:hypothetical protein